MQLYLPLELWAYCIRCNAVTYHKVDTFGRGVKCLMCGVMWILDIEDNDAYDE